MMMNKNQSNIINDSPEDLNLNNKLKRADRNLPL